MKIGKTKRKKLIFKLDQVCSQIVRKRDKRCVICGSTKNLQCSHLIKRGRLSVRFDITDTHNLHTNCASCNYRHNNYPEFYTSWYLDKYGQDEYNRLLDKSQMLWKPTISELEELLAELAKLLKTYED